MKRIIQTGLLLSLVSATSEAQTLARAINVADSLVASSIGKLTPGAVLLVAKDGRIIHDRAFGYAALKEY